MITKGDGKTPSKGPQSAPIKPTTSTIPTGNLGAGGTVAGRQKPAK
jgi:hypothetical protein